MKLGKEKIGTFTILAIRYPLSTIRYPLSAIHNTLYAIRNTLYAMFTSGITFLAQSQILLNGTNNSLLIYPNLPEYC